MRHFDVIILDENILYNFIYVDNEFVNSNLISETVQIKFILKSSRKTFVNRIKFVKFIIKSSVLNKFKHEFPM